jgi:hypothetical protein
MSLGSVAAPVSTSNPSEPKTVKTRIHLDLTVEDLDCAVESVVQRWAGRPVNGTTG